MNKSAILSYILIFGVLMSFVPCQGMQRELFSSEELALTRSSAEDTKMHNGAYLSFYAKINEFSKLGEQTSLSSASALADAKKALQDIQLLDPTNTIFSEFMLSEIPKPDQIAKMKKAVNEVYFTQYPDDFPKAYSWFHQNQPNDIEFIREYDKTAMLEHKIKTLLEYKKISEQNNPSYRPNNFEYRSDYLKQAKS